MKRGVSMRWWLGLAFAGVAAVAVVVGAQVTTHGSEEAFRDRAQDLVAGRAFQAAIDVTPLETRNAIETNVPLIASQRRLAMFVFDRNGQLITPPTSHSVRLVTLPDRRSAVSTALQGRRYARTNDAGGTVVALPLQAKEAAALLVYAANPDVSSEVGIVRDALIEAGVAAVLVGALMGVLIASLLARRLRRVAATAAAVEEGRFEQELRPGFLDEVGQLGVTIDRMRERLRDSFQQMDTERQRLERLLSRLHQGVVLIGPDCRVEFANPAARRLLDMEMLLEGDPLPGRVGDVSLPELAGRLIAAGSQVEEHRTSPTNGRSLALVGVPVQRGEGAILVITDVTEQERRERAEREFVQNAAHELRTPLTTIRAAVEALQAGRKDDPANRDALLAHIDRESDRLTRLIRSLLMLARVQTEQERPHLQPVALRPLLFAATADARVAEGVALDVECAPDLVVHTNEELARQAISNLVDNSAKYTEQGTIRVEAEATGNGTVAVRVIDTGRGITPDEQERMFDRFYRADNGTGDGFGLGLSIAREALTVLGGEIRVDSEPGTGTRATATFKRWAGSQ